jgi:hypothetical protein
MRWPVDRMKEAARGFLLDPSFLVLFAGVIVRIDTAANFDPMRGYDAPGHFYYTYFLEAGRLPRIGPELRAELGIWSSVAQNPPLFYALAVGLRALGFGQAAGTIVSVAAGSARLFLADRIFKDILSLTPRARLFANAVHAFIPFAIRIDVFHSPESLASLFSISAVYFAVCGKAIASGLFQGACLLTKATSVTALPAVLFGLRPKDGALKPWIMRAGIAAAFASPVWLWWAWPNIEAHGTPYPSGYLERPDLAEAYKTPVWRRHALAYYLPRLRESDLTWPYSDDHPTFPNAFYLEAWSDYYNYLGRDTEDAMVANKGPVDRPMWWTHVALAHIGLAFVAALSWGVFDFARRARRRQTSHGELAFALLGAGYLAIAFWFAVWVPAENEGTIKATYALGSIPILSAWTGRAFDALSRRRAGLAVSAVINAAPIAVAFIQRIIW